MHVRSGNVGIGITSIGDALFYSFLTNTFLVLEVNCVGNQFKKEL